MLLVETLLGVGVTGGKVGRTGTGFDVVVEADGLCNGVRRGSAAHMGGASGLRLTVIPGRRSVG